jgi:hypothetical protein
MATDTSQSVPPTNWREREGREPWEDEVLLDLYEQRQAWAAAHGHNLKRMVDHLIERQKENPRLTSEVAPEEPTSQPR